MSTSVPTTEGQLLELITWEFNGRFWILGGEFAPSEVCPEPGNFRLEEWTTTIDTEASRVHPSPWDARDAEPGESDPCTQNCLIIKFLYTDTTTPEMRKNCRDTIKMIAENRGLFEPDFELPPIEPSEIPLLILMDSWNHWRIHAQDIGALPPWMEEVDCKTFIFRNNVLK